MKIERLSLKSDYEQNETFGAQVRIRLRDKYALNQTQIDKLTNHCNEVDTISRLVVSLRMRLRLLNSEEDGLKRRNQEGIPVEDDDDSDGSRHAHPLPTTMTSSEVSEKRDKLSRQLSEALDLKQLIDNRSRVLMDKLLLPRNHLQHQVQEVMNGMKNSDDPSCQRDKTDFLDYVMNKSSIIMRLREVEEEIDSLDKSLDSGE